MCIRDSLLQKLVTELSLRQTEFLTQKLRTLLLTVDLTRLSLRLSQDRLTLALLAADQLLVADSSVAVLLVAESSVAVLLADSSVAVLLVVDCLVAVAFLVAVAVADCSADCLAVAVARRCVLQQAAVAQLQIVDVLHQLQ